MSIKDNIDLLEQQIYVACSEGDYDTVYSLENQLERLRGRMEHPFDDDPSSVEYLVERDDDF